MEMKLATQLQYWHQLHPLLLYDVNADGAEACGEILSMMTNESMVSIIYELTQHLHKHKFKKELIRT